MAREIDLTKPLSEEDVAYLKARLPLERVNYYIEKANEAGETASSTPDEGAQGGSGDEPFDPSSKDVDGVLEYLLTADEAETERVLAAEKAGKARKGILEA